MEVIKEEGIMKDISYDAWKAIDGSGNFKKNLEKRLDYLNKRYNVNQDYYYEGYHNGNDYYEIDENNDIFKSFRSVNQGVETEGHTLCLCGKEIHHIFIMRSKTNSELRIVIGNHCISKFSEHLGLISKDIINDVKKKEKEEEEIMDFLKKQDKLLEKYRECENKCGNYLNIKETKDWIKHCYNCWCNDRNRKVKHDKRHINDEEVIEFKKLMKKKVIRNYLNGVQEVLDMLTTPDGEIHGYE